MTRQTHKDGVKKKKVSFICVRVRVRLGEELVSA
jgi:hypothetical protein